MEENKPHVKITLVRLPREEVSSPYPGACKQRLASPWSGVQYAIGETSWGQKVI